MSRRHEKAAHDTVRLNDPSLRLILGVVTAAPLVTVPKAPIATDPIVEVCEVWLARHVEPQNMAHQDLYMLRCGFLSKGDFDG